MKIRYRLLIITLTVGITTVSGQVNHLKFNEIGLARGLSQSTVNAIIQDNYGFMWFGTQDGLNRYDGYSIKVFKHDVNDSNSVSDNTISRLLTSKDGYIWIGTESGGLNKYIYPENRFQHFMHHENDQSSLSSNHITALCEDQNKNLWVGSNRGVDLLLNGRENFIRINLHFSFGNPGKNVRAICDDSDGNLWIAEGGGLYRFNSGYLKIADYNFQAEDLYKFLVKVDISKITGTSEVLMLYPSAEGLLFGIDGKGVFKCDTKNNEFSRLSPLPLYGNFIISILKDTNNNLWVGTFDGGLNLFDSDRRVFDLKLEESVSSLCEDNSGLFWIGTWSKGVMVYDRRKNKFISYHDDPQKSNDLNGNVISSILVDKDSNLWVGTWGNGLNRFNKEQDKIEFYVGKPGNKNGIPSNLIYALCESGDGNIWIGTQTGGLSCYLKKDNLFINFRHSDRDENTIISDNVSRLNYDNEENILWIGYWDGGVSAYDLSDKKFTHFRPDKSDQNSISTSAVTVIYKGAKTGLWIGTARGGLNNFIETESHSHKINGIFKKFQGAGTGHNNGSGSDTVINSNGILSVYEDKAGIVWIGTSGRGLDRYNPSDGTFKYFTTRNGLANDFVYGILPDETGNLWLSTNKGISEFNPGLEEFTNYDVKDGLQSDEFNEGAYYRSSSGELFFGGMQGLTAFFPEDITKNDFVPPVYITSFKVFDESLALPNPIPDKSIVKLAYSQNFFSFDFAALNYTAPEKSLYSYKLDGFDKKWHNVTAGQRFGSYTNLDPGKYVLHVKASNNDGIWNEKGASLEIIVTPPFWMTWWFRLLAFTFIAGIVFLLYKFRIRQLLKIERIRFQIATDLHDDVGTSLTGIALYSDLAKVEIRTNSKKVIDRLDNIAELSRSLLDRMNDIVWFIKPENDSLQSAILRMSDTATGLFEAKGIEHRMNIHGELSNINLSMDQRRNLLLIFKEMLNNVIKHSGAARVSISVNVDGKRTGTEGILITVEDDGCGFDKDKNYKGNGLKNIRERAGHIGAELKVFSSPGQGSSVQLFAPFKIT